MVHPFKLDIQLIHQDISFDTPLCMRRYTKRLHDSFEGITKRQVREDLHLALRLSDGDGPIIAWITGSIGSDFLMLRGLNMEVTRRDRRQNVMEA
jgi:hypothetical protein